MSIFTKMFRRGPRDPGDGDGEDPPTGPGSSAGDETSPGGDELQTRATGESEETTVPSLPPTEFDSGPTRETAADETSSAETRPGDGDPRNATRLRSFALPPGVV